VAQGRACLCHVHTKFFSSPEKLLVVLERNASIFQTQPQRRWAVDMLKAAHRAGVPLKCVIMAHLQRLETSTDFYNRQRAEYMYQTYLMARILRPHSSPQLWIRAMQRQINVLQFCAEEPGVPGRYWHILRTLLEPFLVGCKPSFAIRSLLRMIRALPPLGRPPPGAVDLSGQMWRGVLEYSFSALDMRPFVGANMGSFIADAMGPPQAGGVLDAELQDWVRRVLRGYITVERKRLAGRIRPFKEGLIAAAWHPRRVEAWLQAGLEVDDL
jgi:hypothetical protein